MAAKLGLLVVVLSISFPDTALAVHEPLCSYGPESTNEWGQWEYVGNIDILAVHAALLSNGNVLLFGGSEHTEQFAGKVNTPDIDKTRIYNPETKKFTPIPAPPDFTDVFCSGSAQISDGRIIVAGGTGGWPNDMVGGIHSAHFPGTRATWMFVPTRDGLGDWEREEDMNFEPRRREGGGRWYPTLVTLPDGRVLAMSGHPALGDTRHINNAPEVFTTGGWRLLSDDIGMQGPSTHYPNAYVLPPISATTPRSQKGEVFFASRALDGNYYLMDLTTTPPLWRWVAGEIGGDDKSFYEPDWMKQTHYPSTSVLLPLDPANNYEPKVLLMGGEKAKLIEPRGSSGWRDTAGPRQLIVPEGNMNKAPRRTFASSVILPTGHVILTGGVGSTYSDDTGVREVELYNPDEDKWYLGPKACAVRNYHSVALLLPDGSVLVAGSNHNAGINLHNRELRVEVFKPWYFNQLRPSLLGVPRELPVGRPFPFIVSVAKSPSIIVDDEGNIPRRRSERVRELVLIRASTTTHGLNTDQRLVRLSFNTIFDGPQLAILSAKTPPDSNVAPPGYYLMFAITESGIPSKRIPSKGKFIRITNRQGPVLEDLFPNRPGPVLRGLFPGTEVIR